MSKSKQYFAVVVASFAALFVEAFSGFVLWLVLPHGSGMGRGRGGGLGSSSFIFDRGTWLDIHDWAAIALIIFIILHIAMHWKWIVRMLKSLGGKGKAHALVGKGFRPLNSELAATQATAQPQP